MTTAYSTNELLVCEVARHIQDEELAFVGVGSNGRAFTLAVGIPLAAIRLAQLTHAPSAGVHWGNLLDADLSIQPTSISQDVLTNWPAGSCPVDTGYKCDMLARGAFDLCFDSAAQVDQFGNLNITAIGDYRKPKVRLVGSLAQPEHLAYVKRPIIMMDLSRQTFVPEVDFITSVGHVSRGQTRAEIGLSPGGPALVVTNKATFDFDPDSHRMRVRTLHPGVMLEEVLDNMSFMPVVPSTIGQTSEPSAHELELIRSEIDPHTTFLIA